MTNHALGFALLSDKEGTLYIAELNKKINETYPSEFVLNEKGFLLPHVSFFQGQFPEERLKQVFEAFEKLAENHNRLLKINTAGINVWATKIFFLDIDKEPLQKLHEDIFSSFNGLRNQEAGSADPQPFVGITQEEAESFKTYWYPFTLKAFRPHFTIGRSELMDGKEQAFAKQLEKKLPPPRTITFNKFVIFDVGKYGRLEGIRREYTLI